LGVDWTFHDLPFHRSANVTPKPDLLKYPPTAVQAAADVHATPDNWLPLDVAGLGVRVIVHEWPFHRSANVLRVPDFAT
jgi:hypothetical protein